MKKFLSIFFLIPILAFGQRPTTNYPPLTYDPSTGDVHPETTNGHTIVLKYTDPGYNFLLGYDSGSDIPLVVRFSDDESFVGNSATAAASQRATKSYVDGGLTNGTTSAVFANVTMTDLATGGIPAMISVDTNGLVDFLDPVTVVHGGIGVQALTAYAPLFGGTTTTNPVQSGTVGTAGQILTSNGAGVLPTFQAAPSSGAPTTASYITQVSESGLSAEQALASLSTGIMKVTTTTGVVSSLGDPLPVANGGTNISSYAVGDLIYASGSTTLSKLADVATGSVLVSGGVTTAPAWSSTPTFTGTNISGTAASLNIGGSAASLSVSGQTGLMTVMGLASTNRAKTVRDAADTILELGGSYTPTGTWTNMIFATPNLGTPSALVVTNASGTASININGTVGATTPTTGAFTTLSATGAYTNSKSGAASVSAGTYSGVPFAGTGTTSFPLVYINDANATSSTTLSTSGTSLGVNAHTGIGNLLDLKLDGTTKFKVTSGGSVTSGDITIASSGISTRAGSLGYFSATDFTLNSGVILIMGTADVNGAEIFRDLVNGFSIRSGAGAATFNDGNTANSGTVSNRYLFGIAAPTLTSTGTSVTDTVASTVYIGGAPAASTNTTITTPYALYAAAGVTKLNGPVIVSPGYTVATLPSTAATGMVIGARAYVTDALAPTFLGTLTGGGVIVTPVFYNGSAWVSD